MISKAPAPGWSFKELANYLEHGERGAEAPHRVEWIETRNLPTDNLHAAARIMAATARDSDSIQPPVYHFVISFAPDDPVDRRIMRLVAYRVLRDLELQEHQVVIVAHADRAHLHMHFMVNRVHPERLKAWSNWHDWARIERSLRALEQELGLRVVPGKHAPVPGHTPAPRRIRGNAEFLARVQAQAGPILLDPHTSWGEVERRLGEHGLSVRIKNGGMVVTDGTYEVKASEVDRAASRNHLERRLGSLGAYRARQAVAARTLHERAARVARAAPEQAPAPTPDVQPRTPAAAPVQPPSAPRPAAPTPAPAAPIVTPTAAEPPPRPRDRERTPVRVPRAKVEHRRVAARYRAAMERLYIAPSNAAARFRKALVRHGRHEATEQLRKHPESFGFIRKDTVPAQERAQEAAREALHWSRRLESSGRVDALRIAGVIGSQVAARAYDEAEAALERDKSRLADLGASREHVRSRVRDLARVATQMYQKPRKALRKLARAVRREGADRAAKMLQTAPEKFGALRGVERRNWRLAKEWDTTAARERAPAAAAHLPGLDTYRRQAAKAGEVRRALDAVRQAERRVTALWPRADAPTSAKEMDRQLTEVAMQLATEQGQRIAFKLAPMLGDRATRLIRTALRNAHAAIAAEAERARQAERARDERKRMRTRGDRDRGGGWSL